jgi:micrococcal nuclease
MTSRIISVLLVCVVVAASEASAFHAFFVKREKAESCLTMTVSPAHIKRVLDGDTFALYHVGVTGEEHVRLLGYDTPERGEPGHREATEFTREWLLRGPFQMVTCGRDGFGRLLAAITRSGEILGQQLEERGLLKSEENP